MRKIRKSKPLEQAIEQYTLYHTVVYTSWRIAPCAPVTKRTHILHIG